MEFLERKDGESAHWYARRVLLYNIVSLNLKPGDRIRENEICQQLNVSRTPVREGILDLAQHRLIEIFPQSGTYVSKIDLEYVENARYLRQVLESQLAREASQRKTPELLDRLRKNVDEQKKMEKIGKQFLQLDGEFHEIIYEMCARDFLLETLSAVCAHLDRARLLSYHNGVSPKILQDHERILQAIVQGDGETAYVTAYQHMERELEDEPMLRKKYPQYYKK
ncbi:MAG: GntR family transcriptional regulator [Ruthenibacterium sp.]